MRQKRRRNRLVIVHVWPHLSRQPGQTPHAANRTRSETRFEFMRDTQRRNDGMGLIRYDGGYGHLTDAQRLTGQDVCTESRCLSAVERLLASDRVLMMLVKTH
jgi:hypothetical protein